MQSLNKVILMGFLKQKPKFYTKYNLNICEIVLENQYLDQSILFKCKAFLNNINYIKNNLNKNDYILIDGKLYSFNNILNIHIKKIYLIYNFHVNNLYNIYLNYYKKNFYHYKLNTETLFPNL